MSSVGVNVAQHQDVLQSVKKSLGETTELTVANLLESFTQADLVELSNSIQQQQNKRQRKAGRRQRPHRKVVFCTSTPDNSTSATLNWKYGESLLDLAKSVSAQQVLEGLDHMEGPCGGQMACSTCHVYLDPKTHEALPPPVDEELDMLDLAFEPKPTSRLGCQVKLDAGLIESLEVAHEMIVTLPSGANNEREL